MKQKNNGIKRLLEFTGNKRGVLNLSRILSGISAIFILGPFLCVYFAARDLVDVFTGSPLDTESLVRWGISSGADRIASVLLRLALFSRCCLSYRKKFENGRIKAPCKNAYGIF